MVPLHGRVQPITIYGLDTESCDNNKTLICISIYGKNLQKFYRTKEDFFYDFTHLPRDTFRNSMIFCTNLKFDLFMLFDKKEAFRYFDIIERGSGLICAKTMIDFENHIIIHPTQAKKNKLAIRGKVERKNYWDKLYKVTFCDTLNIYRAPLKKLGIICGIEKLESPEGLGKIMPTTTKEWALMEKYNMQDSKITYSFINFFQETLNSLGGKLKPTIASCSLDLYRRQFLQSKIKCPEVKNVLLEWEGYYGGRTEAFWRGIFGISYTYDKNSLYPSEMHNNPYPFGESLYINKCTIDIINAWDGVCYVEMFCPPEIFPFLPVKTEKLIFPTGLIKGYYSFFEIRIAINIGYKLLNIGDASYYKSTMYPFKGYVSTLYEKRMEFQKEQNHAQEFMKSLLNNLYGKFGFKYNQKEKLMLKTMLTTKNIINDDIKPYMYDDDMVILTSTNSKKPSYVIPIWSIYVTAYGRWSMYEEMRKAGFEHILYIDTDGIKIERYLGEGNKKLGDFKLEDTYKELCILKPKMYSYLKPNGEEKVRLKGCSKDINLNHFNIKACFSDSKSFTAHLKIFRTLRSAYVSGSYVNEIYDMEKEFNIYDNKRQWLDIVGTKQKSIALHFEGADYILKKDYSKLDSRETKITKISQLI